jgi:hypothetical protein
MPHAASAAPFGRRHGDRRLLREQTGGGTVDAGLACRITRFGA